MSPRRTQGALATLAVAFFASAAMRAGDVIAALPGVVDDGFGSPVAAASGTPSAPETDVPTLVADLRAARAAVAERERALAERAQVLEAIEIRLETRLRELEAAQRRLEETAVLVDDAAGRDVRHLAEMYRQMKPKQAAEIFNRMPPGFAAGFLGEMPSEAAALILANMEADRAYAVSILLAGRNVDPSTP